MKSKQQTAVELTAELERLNALVRQRRKQLAFLERCPHTDCECRHVWREVVERKLSSQVGTISRGLRQKARPGGPKKTNKRNSGTR